MNGLLYWQDQDDDYSDATGARARMDVIVHNSFDVLLPSKNCSICNRVVVVRFCIWRLKATQH